MRVTIDGLQRREGRRELSPDNSHRPSIVPPSPPDPTVFLCNLCGASNSVDAAQIDRETPSCGGCGSTVRFRGIVAILASELWGRPLPLWSFPDGDHNRGVGLSDAECYAKGLAERLNYTNTFYHQDPLLDIAVPPGAEQQNQYDFLISSEVFEHVPPPAKNAFSNAALLLKPGGLLLLTVPYRPEGQTEEHFPHLHEYDIVETTSGYVLNNVRLDGTRERFDSLVFHGGPGSTLEMRVFSLTDLVVQLKQAGFSEPRIWDDAFPEWGVYWRQPWPLPLTARRLR